MRHYSMSMLEGLSPSASQSQFYDQVVKRHLFPKSNRGQFSKLVAFTVYVFAFLFVYSLDAQAQAAPSSISMTSEKANELEHLVKQDCGSCHGMTLQGGLGPALTQDALADKPAQYLVDTILYGKEAQAMPPWKALLSEQEVKWIVEQLKNGSMSE